VATDDDQDADFITRTRAKWQAAMPQLDTSPMELLGRINRISAQSVTQLERVLEPSGVSRSEFDVLCALARGGRPLRASEVTSSTMLSGAATTKLTARLESAGLIERNRLERDARVVLLSLTDDGRELVETQLPVCLDQDRHLLDGVDDADQETLARILRTVSANAERAVRE